MVDRALRILQVATADIKGGAERVAWDLFAAYRERGLASWLCVGQKHSADADVFVMADREARGRWFRFWQNLSVRAGQQTPFGRWSVTLSDPLKAVQTACGLEDFGFPATASLLRLPPYRPDIVHAHNLHGYYFDLRMLPVLSTQVPLVITLHDAWMLSGHCAHSLSCERWRTGCGHCPDLTIYPAIRRDATARNWRRKRQIYATARLNVATPSRWLMRKVEDSMLAPTVVDARVVPNGVDLDRFRPGDQRAARAMLGIDQTAWVILTVGIGIRDSRWKDYATLREAVGRITACARDQRMVVLALGEQGPSERVGQVEIRFVPFQSERNVVVDYYRAADVYVHAAHVDTFPTSVLEALACGTPVVATRVGGIPEQVDDGQTGFLVPPRDPEPLAGRTLQLLRDADLRAAIGRSASETAQRRFGLARQVDAYLGWYQELTQAARVQGWYAAAR